MKDTVRSILTRTQGFLFGISNRKVPFPIKGMFDDLPLVTSRNFIEDRDLITSYGLIEHFRNAPQLISSKTSEALYKLLLNKGTRKESVPITKITALSCSKGRFIGNL